MPNEIPPLATKITQIALPIFTAFAAVCIPLLLWYLNRKDKKDDLYNTDRYIKRLELLKKLKEVECDHDFIKISDKHNALLAEEVTRILNFFTTPDPIHTRAQGENSSIGPQPTGSSEKGTTEQGVGEKGAVHPKKFQLRRIFLLYKPASLIVLSLQVLFTITSLFLLLSFSILLFSIFGPPAEDRAYAIVGLSVIFAVFSLLSLLLNVNANKFQDRKLAVRP